MKAVLQLGPMWDTVRFDLRESLRGLRRSPGFSFVVIVTLALSIGGVTTIGSLLNAIVLRTVTAANPDRLIAISATDLRASRAGYLYAETFAAYRSAQHSLSAMSMYRTLGLRVEMRDSTADAAAEGVMPEYFELLGARVAAGRFFTDHDDPVAPVAVLSDRFRRRAFGDAAVIGETVRMQGKPVTIIGVVAPGFTGLQFDGGADVFLPIAVVRSLTGDTRALRSPYIVGRLAPGVTLPQARAELLARWPAIQEGTVPPSLSGAEQQAVRSQRIELDSVASGFSTLRRQYGTSLRLLIALAAVLLAVGCLNLAGLLMARLLARRHQIAVRLALGASRARIFRQVLFEGVLLALGGLLASLPVAWWTIRGLTAMMTIARGIPLQQSLTPDARVLGAVTVVAMLIGVVIAILPAWRAARSGTPDNLRSGHTVVGTVNRSWRLLLVAQVAASMVLLASAGLFTGTLSRLRANDASIHARRIVFARLVRPPGDREQIGRADLEALLERLRAIPGAGTAALSVYFPAYLGFPGELPTDPYARSDSVAQEVRALTEFVSPDFFNTFAIPRLQGRDFTWTDDALAPPVAIISEGLARSLFPHDAAVGRSLRMALPSGKMQEFEIVGVVVDAAIGRIREPHQPVVFRPMLQELARAQFPLAHVSVTGDLKTVRDGYSRVVAASGRYYLQGVFTLSDWVDYALLQERLTAGLSTFGGVLTIVLACIGFVGLLAYTVAARRREIGVRLALGATRSTVIWLVVREGLAIVVCGVLIGVPCALAAAGLVRSQLYGIASNDSSTIIGAGAVFVVVGIGASLLPALRASRIDAMTALRQE